MKKCKALSPKLNTELFTSHDQPNRRDMLRMLASASLLPLVPLFGCGDMESGSPDASDEADGGGGSSSGASGRSGSGAAGSSAGSGATTADWASGGTAAATAKASYPNPFTEALMACSLVATTTEGPCTTPSDLVREDVSDGLPGLPVRLALKVVDASCDAVAGAAVKIWHTNREGSYSGQTPNNNMCLKDQAYASDNFFRGVQTTNEDGEVFFDTCFPGWYRGRAVHIHFQVKKGSTSYRVSQLFFPEDITQAVFAKHSEYSSYGQPDTTFSNDNIMAMIPSAERDRHILAVARMTDGAMLASKVVTVV